MMSSENIPPAVHPPDHNHNATARKPAPGSQKPQEQPQPPALNCPRCDSSNTKFCYYNNYSLTQPRYFCKTCRRYWTKGGALRNVPIGGGCRKTKKHKPSYSCPTSSNHTRLEFSAGPEFKFLSPPTLAPAVDFQLGGLSLPRLHPATAGVYTQFIASSGAHFQPIGVGPGTSGCFSLDLLGLNTYPTIPNNNSSSSSPSLSVASGGVTGIGDQSISISSIESLSSINQEMHWKLQQQRLAMIYGHHEPTIDEENINNNQEKGLVRGGFSLFKNLETTRNNKIDVSGPTPTEWLFDQLQSNSSSANHADNNNNNNSNSNVGANEDFNGVWAAELHHQQQQQHQHHPFNGLQ